MTRTDELATQTRSFTPADSLADWPEFLGRFADRTAGVQALIAVDDTTLGPGLGGIRWARYPSEEAAVAEVRRLARVMTLKNAVAGVPYGGAKAVILRPEPPVADGHKQVMEAFGRFVDRLDGRYVPGVDMGTSLADLTVMGSIVEGVICEDPSDFTAVGVLAGITAALGGSCRGRSVVVQGVGHVGADLAARLTKAGAQVVVADVDAARAQQVGDRLGAAVVDPDDVLGMECDVLAPCAQAGVVSYDTVARLRCTVVAGAANDVLAERGCAGALAARGITYVPDFVINAGGAIRMHALRAGWDDHQLTQALTAIGTRVDRIITAARESRRTPLAEAEALASERLGRRVTVLG
jgi:leucine dehydrogenase